MPGFFSSLALVCALCTICSVGAQTGVCYTMVSTQVSAVGYVQTSRSDSYGCGWFRRCRRTLYGRNSIVTYNTQYSSQFGCCAGYQQSGTTCQPVCNGGCSNGGVCTAPDICSCTAGWIGSNCHIDFDECASSSTNNCGQVCNNNPGSFSCSCNTGYRLHADGHTCPDINECTEGSDLCDHICANSIGSYTCSCNTGYTLSSNQVGCMNDNECVLGTDLCSQVCHDMPGSYTCSCRPGYTLDPNGRTCRDIDECATGTHLCGQNCHNTIGSYTCSCNIGYTLSTNQLGCINDNECLLGTHLCSQVCHDTHGSYTCSCRSGYALDPDGRTCRDIDECAIGTHTCEQNCHNTIGSYTCSCNTGYTLNPNGRICDDINECNSPDHGCQHQCVNFPGSYRCQCNIGYSLNADGFTCSDINECAVGTDNCDQVCHNNVGSFSCTCNPGSTLDSNGYNCNDINECAHPDLNNCQQICTNTDSSYYCECNAGYVLDSNQRTCTDIDECEAGSDLCTQNCWNTIGSYTCSCNDGYTLNADGVTCDDIDECAAETDQCEEICINIPRSYNCLCREGYGLNSDEYSCSDIDECAEGTDLCDHDCSNTNGSYTCSCQTGYIIDEDGYTCDDVNECGGDHMCEDACNNTAGSFHCACRPGYIINNDGRTCRDLDECEEDVDMCDQSCHNNIGSYTCSCGEDYTLNFDGFRCDDINECSAGSVGNTTCEEVCVNTPGSWHCDCFPGYTILANEISCRDEDECSTGNNQCDQMCRNTIGSYTCSCNSSTTLNADGYRCDDIDECAMDLDGCVEVCVNIYGSFYCSCNTGYTINPDGRSCRDINECLAGTDTCEQLCTNNVGSYNCSCNGGSSLTSNRFSCLGPPGGIVFGAINSTTMTLTWGLPQNDSQDGAVINYVVDCDSQSDRWYALDVMRSASDERRVVLRNLRPYYTYSCCVLVETNIGRSPPACVEQTTLEEEPSNPPQNIIINNDADDSLTFNFDPPVTTNGIIIAYTFYVTFENGSSVVIVDNVATGSFHLEGLLPYQLVTVEVSANTSAGEGPKSAVDEIRTAQAVPSKPTAVVVRVTSNSSLTTGWNPPAMDNGILLNYTVRIYNQLNEYSREFVLNPSNLRFISVDDLEPYIPYTVEVAASTVMGKGEPAREIIFTEHGVPVIPTISNVVRTSEGVAKVFWIPLTPDEARGVLTLLQIAYEPATNGLCYDINAEDMRVMTLLENVDTQSEAEIDGLEGSREYCVAIQVSTSAGESGFTDTLKAHYPSDVYVQIRLKLSNQYCGTYIDENPIEKSTAISSAIVETLLLVCDCPYSLEYVTHSRLLCGSNENEAIYQANLLNTDGKTATDLKDVIQLWVDNAPRIRVAGSFQQVDSYCSVNVTEVGNVGECTALNPTTPTEPVVESTKQTLLSNHITAIAWGVGGGVATIFLVVVVIVLVCTCRRKRAGSNLKDKAGFNLNAENDNTQLIGQRDIGTLSRNIVNSHTPANYDQVEYDNPVYGTGPDDQMKRRRQKKTSALMMTMTSQS